MNWEPKLGEDVVRINRFGERDIVHVTSIKLRNVHDPVTRGVSEVHTSKLDGSSVERYTFNEAAQAWETYVYQVSRNRKVKTATIERAFK